MFRQKYFLCLVIVVSAVALADDDLTRVLQNGNNQFSGKMLSNVAELKPNESIVLSGFSVLTPLSLLEVSSTGSTRQELLKAIGLKNVLYIFEVFANIINNLKLTEEVEFKMANKLVVNMNYQLNDYFDAVSRNIFETEVNNADFSDAEQAANEINDWASKKTNHHIKHLINPSNIGENTGVVLVNALYFKGQWKLPFSKQMTKAKRFYVDNQRFVEVLTMHNIARYKYAESRKLDAKILEIPYIGDEASMVVVLPNEVQGLKSLLRKIKNLTTVDEEMKFMKFEDVHVMFPKFKIESSIDLKDVLKRMNVTKIFNKGAEINLLTKSPEPIYVSTAIQKALIEVDEQGSKAAAANALDMSFLSLGAPNNLKQFIANHPFVLFLKIKNFNIFSALYKGPIM